MKTIGEDRPKECVRAFALAGVNRLPYSGVTIGDVHAALSHLASYASCLESIVDGLHQRVTVRDKALKATLAWFHVPSMEEGHSAYPLVRQIQKALADPMPIRASKPRKAGGKAK